MGAIRTFIMLSKEILKNACLFKKSYIVSAPSDAGWSSLVARRAHNPKVVGSNPAPATK